MSHPSPVPLLDLADGTRIPQLGLGTWQLTGEVGRRAVSHALDIGYRHIDTAEAYGNEEEIGRVIGTWDRDDLFITSKVSPDHLRPDDVRDACDGSLELLGTDYLDLYLIHWPNSDIPLEETVEALQELRRGGRIRSWGVSNFTVTHLREALELGQPVVNQVELHPFLRQPALDDFCRDRAIRITAYSPLARGDVTEDKTLADIARRRERTPSQVALRWSIQKGHVVIPKASGEEHLREDFDVFGWELTGDEMRRIDALDRKERLVEPEFAEFDR